MFQAKANGTVSTLTDSLIIVGASDWHHVTVSVEWDKDTRISSINLRVDNIWTGSMAIFGMIHDDISYLHYLGAESETVSPGVASVDNFYTGFIWQVCLYSTYIIDFSDDIGGPCEAAECQVCPVDICLMDCDWN